MTNIEILAVQRATAAKKKARKRAALKEVGWFTFAVVAMVSTVMMFLFL